MTMFGLPWQVIAIGVALIGWIGQQGGWDAWD